MVALKGRDVCFTHAPEMEAARKAAHALGGHNTRLPEDERGRLVHWKDSRQYATDILSLLIILHDECADWIARIEAVRAGPSKEADSKRKLP